MPQQRKQQEVDWFAENAPTPIVPSRATEDFFNPAPIERRVPLAPRGDRIVAGIGRAIDPSGLFNAAQTAMTDPMGPFIGTGRVATDILTGPARRNLPGAWDALKGGRFTDAANAIAASVPIVGPVAQSMSEHAKAGDVAGALAEGGTNLAMLAGPALTRAAMAPAKFAAIKGAQAMLGGAEPAVAEAALAQRAMPGIFRSGESRAAARAASLDDQIRAGLVGNTTPTKAPIGPNVKAAWDDIYNQASAGADATAARNVIQGRVIPTVPETPAQVYGRSAGTRDNMIGRSGPGPDMHRALAADMRAEVAKNAPNVAPSIAKLEQLTPVQDAYAAERYAKLVDPTGVPTMRAKLWTGTVNRIAGPTFQGMYSTATRAPQLMRAALLSRLLGLDGADVPPPE